MNNSSELLKTTDGVAALDVDSYLALMMGERRRDMASVWLLTFAYTIIFITGITGNVCTCIVIVRNAYMHTATNYYLFSLAMSDMLTLLFGLPTEVYGIWEAYPWSFGEPLCIFKSFLAEMTSYASVLTITAFTIERYIAICHPLKAQTLSNLSRAVKMVFSIWVIACLFALPYPIHTRVFPYIVINGTGIADSLQCNIPFEWQKGMTHMFQISTFVFFVFPMAVITIMYGLIGIRLRNSQLDSKHKSKTRARRAVVRMLIAVVVAFFVQWAPFHAQRLMTSYMPTEKWTPSLIKFQSDLFYISGVLYFCNSTINPILYNSMSKKFRLAFKRTLCRCCYTSEELLEINGKSKTIYYSDKTNVKRLPTYRVSNVAFGNLNGTKVISTRPDAVYGRVANMNANTQRLSPTRCCCNYSPATGRLIEMAYQDPHCHLVSPELTSRGKGFAPRALGVRYNFSTNTSLVSLAELESDSVIELKSMSSSSSANLLSTKLPPSPTKGYFNNRDSCV